MDTATKEFRVLVCGGRDYPHWWRVFEALRMIYVDHPKLVVIEGGANGADEAAALWARDLDHSGVSHLQFPADWKSHGLSAGPRRNYVMLEEGKPDLVVAFPGGRGTRDMVQQAREHCVPVCYGEDLQMLKEMLENEIHISN